MNYKIIGKYIKDLNFNIPNSKTFFLLSKEIGNYKINVDIKSNQVKQNIIEVFTSLNLSAAKNDFDTIKTKIVLATIIELSNSKLEKEETNLNDSIEDYQRLIHLNKHIDQLFKKKFKEFSEKKNND